MESVAVSVWWCHKALSWWLSFGLAEPAESGTAAVSCGACTALPSSRWVIGWITKRKPSLAEPKHLAKVKIELNDVPRFLRKAEIWRTLKLSLLFLKESKEEVFLGTSEEENWNTFGIECFFCFVLKITLCVKYCKFSPPFSPTFKLELSALFYNGSKEGLKGRESK